MRQRLSHPFTLASCRVILGITFIAAALPKIAYPPGFAKDVWAYGLLPAWGIHPLALFLPWFELLCGLALCAGVWIRTAASWIAALLLVFTLALSINLARRHPVDCGCFGTASGPRTEAEMMSGIRLAILRDIALLFLVVPILAFPIRRTKCG